MSHRTEIAEALKAIEDATGRLTPDQVIEAARNPDSPLHHRFEWDDARAAAHHRVAVARRIIVSHGFSVRYEKIFIRCPTYIRDPSKSAGEQGYRSVLQLRSEPEEAHAALTAEMARVASIMRRARNLAVVLGLGSRLGAIEAQIGDFLDVLAESAPKEDAPEEHAPA